MPTSTAHRHDPPTPRDQRHLLLTHLATAVRRLGGSALLALAHTAHPVLYVRPSQAHQPPGSPPRAATPVVLVQDLHGGWSFVWGRTGWADSSQAEAVAARLARPVPAARTPHQPVSRKQVA